MNKWMNEWMNEWKKDYPRNAFITENNTIYVTGEVFSHIKLATPCENALSGICR